jgi:hypothetical protein
MMASRAMLRVTSGPNAGDAVSVEFGSCRLIGRHLSEAETAFLDRDGCRMLDGSSAEILTEHLKDKSPDTRGRSEPAVSSGAFSRGPDIIFADDSISRAHAMVFYDEAGFGIIDLASTNGTFVDNERVSSALVRRGKVITVGNSELTLELEK